MNEFVATRFSENVRRLALGLEPFDAGRGTRIAHPISVQCDGAGRGLPGPRIDRHESCLHALIYQPGLGDRISLRFSERSRRFVQRRISYPVLTIAQAEALSYRNRVRRPLLFAGAAYELPSCATGIRGRVIRNNQPLRWVRVVATLPGTAIVVGCAHGDDRGEFLLLIDAIAGPPGDLVDPLSIRLDIFAPALPPQPSGAEVPSLDPLWDLPIEQAQELDANDPAGDEVSSGKVLPAGYTASTGRMIDVPLGSIFSDPTEFNIS